ncbi:MAG: beta-lactamase family protein [Gemmatimonadota bacterium]|nr:MAG: beta-lactamase family protein [Gemmatimonadota bacterium]
MRWALVPFLSVVLLAHCGSESSLDWVLDRESLEPAQLLLQSSVESDAFPGAVLAVGLRDTVEIISVGQYGDNDPRPVTDSTVYDLASLTKVIGLTTAVMLLVADGAIDLDDPVDRYLPSFAGPGKDAVTIRHLLTHTAGLEAWRPLHLETETREEAIDSVMAATLQSVPGETYVYSDFGAITLGLVVEQVSGTTLDMFLSDRVFEPLGMRWTRYRPPAEWVDRIAPTELDPWREQVVRGEVHDENAARLEGVAGHAGLFSIAPDLARFARWILAAHHGRLPPGSEPFLPTQLVQNFTSRQPGPEGSTRALGWDTPSETGSSAGTMMSRSSSFGHTGFTGTSIWIDADSELFVILLTNRVHPTRENRALLEIRGPVADSVVVGVSR